MHVGSIVTFMSADANMDQYAHAFLAQAADPQLLCRSVCGTVCGTLQCTLEGRLILWLDLFGIRMDHDLLGIGIEHDSAARPARDPIPPPVVALLPLLPHQEACV